MRRTETRQVNGATYLLYVGRSGHHDLITPTLAILGLVFLATVPVLGVTLLGLASVTRAVVMRRRRASRERAIDEALAKAVDQRNRRLAAAARILS